MAMNVTPFVGTDNFNMETFNNMISQINNGVNSEISEVLAQLGTKAKIQTGSYVGTGTYGANNPCNLTFDFKPSLIILSAKSYSPPSSVATMIYGVSNAYYYYGTNTGANINITWKNNSISYYATLAERQFNVSNIVYFYCVIG